jgi:hypothetical protein
MSPGVTFGETGGYETTDITLWQKQEKQGLRSSMTHRYHLAGKQNHVLQWQFMIYVNQ